MWPSLRVLSQQPISNAVSRAAVVGAGQMGTGIALVSARNARTPVTMFDSNAQALDKSLAFIDALLEKDIKKGKLSNEDANAARERISISKSINDLGDPDIVLEAVAEHLETKYAICSALASSTRPDTILSSNTSSISLTRIARHAATTADRVVGLHWFNPVPVLKLVELIRPLQASQQSVDKAKAFAEACGKTVCTAADVPGFVGNRILLPMINEAVQLLETGVATKEDIDNIMKLGMAHPMGPLQLADFIGLDTCLSIMQVLHHETGDSKYRASVLLSRMVDAGHLGKKSGKGFYDY